MSEQESTNLTAEKTNDGQPVPDTVSAEEIGLGRTEDGELIIQDLTGVVVVRERVQYPRAPLTELEKSKTDYVADYFRERNTEPNYEEIAAMVLPYKYVNSEFRVYPLILGDKEGMNKVRMLSDGSGLHLGIKESNPGEGIDAASHWLGSSHKLGFRSGAIAAPVDAVPRWKDGYLPVAQWVWEQQGARYRLETFATLLPDTTTHLCAWVRVRAERLEPDAVIAFHVDFGADAGMQERDGYLVEKLENEPLPPADGAAHHYYPQALYGGYSTGWRFDEATQMLSWQPDAEDIGGEIEATFVMLNEPTANGMLLEWPSSRIAETRMNIEQARVDSGQWLAHWAKSENWVAARDTYCQDWDAYLEATGTASVSEPVVNYAQRAARIASHIIATRNQLSYSTQNPYERVYTDETGQSTISLAYWGHLSAASRYLGQLAFYTQKGLLTHDLGTRLQWFSRYISLSGDETFLRHNRERMHRWASQLVEDTREEHHGLAPPNQHCGDLEHLVYSAAANTNAWRGLRDCALLLEDEQLIAHADRYRQSTLTAMEASLDTTATPPFLPMSLYSTEEPVPDTLMSSVLGAYWALMATYTLYSGIAPLDHPVMRAMLDTYRERSGLCGGLVRWTDHPVRTHMSCLLECGLDEPYTPRLTSVFALLDDPEQLVLTLYGKLGIGYTQHTFIGGEVSSLAPSRTFGDESMDGRSLYLPPNTASNATYLTLLRHCLVFDFDSAGDGKYDTLRLAFSTPRRWLADGERITVQKMPTAFGEVAYEIVSHIDTRHSIEAVIDLPSRNTPHHVFIRLRVPKKEGRLLRKVFLDGIEHKTFDSASETIDISHCKGRVILRAEYN